MIESNNVYTGHIEQWSRHGASQFPSISGAGGTGMDRLDRIENQVDTIGVAVTSNGRDIERLSKKLKWPSLGIAALIATIAIPVYTGFFGIGKTAVKNEINIVHLQKSMDEIKDGQKGILAANKQTRDAVILWGEKLNQLITQ